MPAAVAAKGLTLPKTCQMTVTPGAPVLLMSHQSEQDTASSENKRPAHLA